MGIEHVLGLLNLGSIRGFLMSLCHRDGSGQRRALELVDAILAAFFTRQEKPVEKARKLLIMRRKGLI